MSEELVENMEPEAAAKVPPLDSSRWLREIQASEKNLEKWHESGRKIVRRFLDKRTDGEEGANKINLFTSNTQILMTTLYAKFPKPLVTREFEDQDDEVARVASTIMQRMLKIRSRDDVDCAMRAVVQDRLVPGLGTVWLRYEPTIEKQRTEAVVDQETGETLVEAQETEKIVDEKVVTDYVFWEDFLWSPSRTWEKNRWVGRRLKMNRQEVTERFGDVVAGRLKYKKDSIASGSNSDSPERDDIMIAEVYEIWCKRTRKIYWVSPGLEVCCDVKDDTLKLDKFWPCPKPLIALTSTTNFVPRPDFLLAQDQYTELDEVNERITWIQRAIKVIGVYDGTNAEIERIFNEGVNNKIIPARSFREFMEKGGMKGAIDWLPIDAFVAALERLRTYRQDLISQIYELTGISDIMRGSSKASETLGAQQLKAQYGSVKLQFLQMEVAAFLEELLDIKAEIICNHFQPETLIRQSNVEQIPADAQFAAQAIELIKSGQFETRVEVNADSMAVPEFNAERDGRMGFIRAISEMMMSAAPILEKSPEAGIAMLKIVQWGAASFKTGNTIESVLDEAIRSIEKSVAKPKPPPPPSPRDVAAAKRDDSQSVLNLAKAKETEANMVLALTEPAEPKEGPRDD